MSKRTSGPRLALGLAFLAAVALPAWAFSPYQDEIAQRYHRAFSCEVCHEGAQLNKFGKDFKFAMQMEDKDPLRALAYIELLDSDGDGWSNSDELTAGAYPGNKASVPAEGAPLAVPAEPGSSPATP